MAYDSEQPYLTDEEKIAQQLLPSLSPGGQTTGVSRPPPEEPEISEQPSTPTAAPATTSAPAASATFTPAPNSGGVRSWPDMVRGGIAAQQRNAANAEKTVGDLASAPSEDQALAPLVNRRATDATPLDPNAAQYAPTAGQKFRRGLTAVLGGMGGGRGLIGGTADALKTDYQAPNRQYGIDAAKQQATVASDDSQITSAKDAYKAMIDRAKATTGLYKDVAATNNDVTKAATDQGKAEEEVNKDKETGRHNQADEGLKGQAQANTAKYQTGELANRKAELGIEGGRLGLERRKEDYEEGAGAGGSSLPGKAGDLSTIPENLRGMVQAIGEGRQAPVATGRKEGQMLMGLVNKVYPDYDASQFHNYQATRSAFSDSSKTGQGINSFNTAITHLGRMENNLPDNTSVPILNKGINFLKDASGSAANTPFEADQLAVAGEIGKAYKGGVLSKEEHDQYMKLLDRDASPKQQHSNIGELKSLLGGKLDSYEQQYKSGLPTGAVRDFKIVSDDARAVLDRGKSTAADLPDRAAKVLQEGKVHTFGNGQQWTKQNGQPVRVK